MIFPPDISKEQVNKLPLSEYPGEILMVDNMTALKKALRRLEKYPYLGFDTETKPAFRKGVYYPVSLLQLAVEDLVYLVRLNKMGFPDPLRQLFSNQDTLKVGISIRDDLAELKKLSNFKPNGIVELNKVAKELGVVREGARNLTATFLGFRISKSQQTTNWERADLTKKQQRYAATDAWVCYQIYHKLMRQGFVGSDE
jgi:ribonuclease D